jgi:hypothetical protein
MGSVQSGALQSYPLPLSEGREPVSTQVDKGHLRSRPDWAVQCRSGLQIVHHESLCSNPLPLRLPICVSKWLVHLTSHPEPMQKYRQLPCYRYHCSLLRVLSAPRSHKANP